MPVEIRELVIKTEVYKNGDNIARNKRDIAQLSEQEMINLKLEIYKECKRLIKESTRRDKYKR